MADEDSLKIVFRTSQYAEAAMLRSMLGDSSIPAETLGADQSGAVVDGGESMSIRIVVPASLEAKAVALIEAHMKSIGFEPRSEAPPTGEHSEALLPCPNCETVGLALREACSGCGFVVLAADAPPVFVKEHAPGARSFCPACRDPLTLPSGKCRACAEELEPLENGDRLCPSLEHVLYRDTVGGFVCKACKRIWVDLAA